MRPDNRADHAQVVAATATQAIRRLDAATTRQQVVSAHADWCEWAERNHVCRQIREHLNDKARALKARHAPAPVRDHKLHAAGDR